MSATEAWRTPRQVGAAIDHLVPAGPGIWLAIRFDHPDRPSSHSRDAVLAWGYDTDEGEWVALIGDGYGLVTARDAYGPTGWVADIVTDSTLGLGACGCDCRCEADAEPWCRCCGENHQRST